LHKACRRCHFPAADELINFVKTRVGDVHPFVRMVNRKGESALHYAAVIKKASQHFPGEDQRIVKLLMDNGADVFAQTSEDKDTVFHYAAREGSVSVLREILANLHSGQIQLAVNKQAKNGWSPLIVAASKGHTEISMV